MTARFTLIASGATSATRRSAFPLDEPLEDKAMAQAAAMAGKVRDAERIWCGPDASARQTAAAMGLTAEVDPRLRHLDFGRWAGKGAEELMTADPSAVAAWLSDPAAAPHGGESLLDLIGRVGAWLNEQVSRTSRGIVITDGACICAAVVHVLQAPPKSFWRIDIPPLSFTSLSGREGQWRLRSAGCRFKDSAVGD